MRVSLMYYGAFLFANKKVTLTISFPTLRSFVPMQTGLQDDMRRWIPDQVGDDKGKDDRRPWIPTFVGKQNRITGKGIKFI